MKLMLRISILMFAAVVTIAARPENSKCRPITLTYSECDANNKITITRNPPEGVEGCTTSKEEVSCVISFTRRDPRENCTQTITTDLTACGTPGGDLNSLMKTITVSYNDCPKDPNVIQIPCSESGKMGEGHRHGMHGGNMMRGSWFQERAHDGQYENDTCKPYTLSYTPCVDNKMSLTKTPPVGVEGCTPVTEEIPCVDTQTSTWGECPETKTTDNTACGTTGGDLSTLVKTITITYTGCTKDPKTFQIPCNMSRRMDERRGMHGGSMRGSWFRGRSNNERHGNDKCKPYTLSYTPCTADNKMNLTKTPSVGVEGCTPVTEEIACVDTQSKTWGECTQTKTTDNTACGTPGGDVSTLVKTITFTYTGCTKDTETIQISCNRSRGDQDFRRPPAGNGMSQMHRGNNRQESGSGRSNGERGRSGFGSSEGFREQPLVGGMAGMRGFESRQENRPRQNSNKEKARNDRF